MAKYENDLIVFGKALVKTLGDGSVVYVARDEWPEDFCGLPSVTE
jgi:hypothetical protein